MEQSQPVLEHPKQVCNHSYKNVRISKSTVDLTDDFAKVTQCTKSKMLAGRCDGSYRAKQQCAQNTPTRGGEERE